jgi:hypothetical protein
VEQERPDWISSGIVGRYQETGNYEEVADHYFTLLRYQFGLGGRF